MHVIRETSPATLSQFLLRLSQVLLIVLFTYFPLSQSSDKRVTETLNWLIGLSQSIASLNFKWRHVDQRVGVAELKSFTAFGTVGRTTCQTIKICPEVIKEWTSHKQTKRWIQRGCREWICSSLRNRLCINLSGSQSLLGISNSKEALVSFHLLFISSESL